MSRLNQALVVAYGAMSCGNLQAVDRVVKIARELTAIMALSPPSGAVPGQPGSRRLRKACSRSRRGGLLARGVGGGEEGGKRRPKSLKWFNPRPGLAPLGEPESAGGGPASQRSLSLSRAC